MVRGQGGVLRDRTANRASGRIPRPAVVIWQRQVFAFGSHDDRSTRELDARKHLSAVPAVVVRSPQKNFIICIFFFEPCEMGSRLARHNDIEGKRNRSVFSWMPYPHDAEHVLQPDRTQAYWAGVAALRRTASSETSTSASPPKRDGGRLIMDVSSRLD